MDVEAKTFLKIPVFLLASFDQPHGQYRVTPTAETAAGTATNTRQGTQDNRQQRIFTGGWATTVTPSLCVSYLLFSDTLEPDFKTSRFSKTLSRH